MRQPAFAFASALAEVTAWQLVGLSETQEAVNAPKTSVPTSRRDSGNLISEMRISEDRSQGNPRLCFRLSGKPQKQRFRHLLSLIVTVSSQHRCQSLALQPAS